MEKWTLIVIPAILTFISGYIISYWNHGLTVRREAANRRRDFRNFIRLVPFRFDGIHPMNFLKTYDESVPVVKEACIKIFEDISLWKRHSFIKHQGVYCGFKHSDLQLPTNRCTPADLPIRMKENQKKREEMIVILKDTLESITRDAG